MLGKYTPNTFKESGSADTKIKKQGRVLSFKGRVRLDSNRGRRDG